MRESVFLSVKKVKRWPKSSFTHNFNIHTGEKNTAVGYGVSMFSEESSLPGAFYYLRYAGYACFGSGGRGVPGPIWIWPWGMVLFSEVVL